MIRSVCVALAAVLSFGATFAPTPAAAQVARVIQFYNACTSPVEFIINHSNGAANWHPHGWYKLRPYQSSTFTENAGGALLTQMDGYSLYFYARSTDGTGQIWRGSNTQSFQGVSYGFAKMNTSVSTDGSLRATITCDRPANSANQGGYSSGASPVGRIINFYNSCRSPVEFIINSSPGAANWRTNGWYSLRPYASSTFSANGITLRQSDGYSLYFYARSTDGSNRVWSGTNRQMFQSAEYPFMKMATTISSDGSLRASITCD